MIAQNIQDALNRQINAELYSAYLYMSMSAYFQSQNLSGFAHWMEIQAMEEFTHAKKFYDFLVERGGRIVLNGIDQPPTEWKSPEDVFTAVYTHEQKVTSLIDDLVDLAIGEIGRASCRERV